MDHQDASTSLAARRRRQIEQLDAALRTVAAESAAKPLPEEITETARRLAEELNGMEPTLPKDRQRR